MKNKTLLIIISIIILLIIWPLLKMGYIFSLDQVLSPNWWTPSVWSNIFWVAILSQVFSFLHIPVWILEKILIILTFVLPSLWIFLLLKDKNDKKRNIWILFAVLLLICNPFLYARFLDGQINIYLSYSLYPLFFYFIKNVLEKYTHKRVTIVWLWSLLLCLTSIHNAVFIFFIGVIFSLFYIKWIGIKKIWTIAMSLILCNTLWVIPFFFFKHDKFELSKQIDNFWIENQEAFKTQWTKTSIYGNTLSLHWYWWESQKRFVTTSSVNDKYKRLFFVLFLIVLIWIYARIRAKKFWSFEQSLLAFAILSYILSLWVSWNNFFSPISSFLYEYFPMYKWLREPQKWIIFLVIFYAYFGAFWIIFIKEKLSKIPLDIYTRNIVLYCIIFVPVFYSFQTLWWFSGQVSIHQYPEKWAEVKNILTQKSSIKNTDTCLYLLEKKSNKCYETLSLPWHSYIHVKFTQKVVWWWIVRYFWDNIMIADNLEYAGIYSQSTRPESKIIEKYIWPWGYFKDTENIEGKFYEEFITDLQWLWIKNILFLKEADYKWYKEFLDKLEEESLINITKENDMIILYKVSSN